MGSRPPLLSLAIVTTVLTYTWILAPITPRWTALVAGVIVLALAVWRAWTSDEWGLAPSHFRPSLQRTAIFTAAAAAVLGVAGWLHGSWHARTLTVPDLAILALWALGQQFALQIALLRELQAASSRTIGVVIAAVLFAALHLPNPFLSTVTLVAALAWCRIYDRHPHVIPLALSHTLLTIVVLTALDDSATGRLRVGIVYLARH